MRGCSDRILWKKVMSFVEKEHLIEAGDKVLMGLSGGADSVCLARFLLWLREELGTELLAVHVNHGIRGPEADRDEAFVREFCSRRKISLEIVSVDVPSMAAEQGLSLEEAGRAARYEHFDRLARDHGCSKIAVAHHGNDLAETMIFRMVRGTGPAGLAAMTTAGGKRIRPLLCLTRREVEEILDKLGQDYVEDSSNLCADFSRNYIRQQIVPGLEEMNARFIDHMRNLSFLQAEQTAYLEQVLDRRLEKVLFLEEGAGRIGEEDYRSLLPYERKEALRRMLFYVCGRRRDIGSVHVGILERLMDLPEGSSNDLPWAVRAVRTREGIFLASLKKGSAWRYEEGAACLAGSGKAQSPDPGEDGFFAWGDCLESELDMDLLEQERELRVIVDGEGRQMLFRLEKWQGGDPPKSRCIKYFDYDKIKSTLRIRFCLPGDYFVMGRAGHKKRLRRYFIDEKIPLKDRGRILLLAEGSHVLWILGRRDSEGCRIDESTVNVLRVEIPEQDLTNSMI